MSTSNDELEQIKSIISNKLGLPQKAKRGRPPKAAGEKYKSIAIRLNPKVLSWFKEESKKEGKGYQTLINEALLSHVNNRLH